MDLYTDYNYFNDDEMMRYMPCQKCATHKCAKSEIVNKPCSCGDDKIFLYFIIIVMIICTVMQYSYFSTKIYKLSKKQVKTI